jgi:uncharacterized protein (TIGR02301 family)
MIRCLLLAAFLIVSTPATAQERSPAERQALVDLAYVLGESHALRQACEGEGDQFWRQRMIALSEVETPDEALDRRLRTAFNTGFVSAQAAHAECGPEVRQALARAAAQGRALALRIR